MLLEFKDRSRSDPAVLSFKLYPFKTMMKVSATSSLGALIIFATPRSDASGLYWEPGPNNSTTSNSMTGATHRLLSHYHGSPQLSPLLRQDTNFVHGTLWSQALQKNLLEKMRAEESSGSNRSSNATSEDNQRNLQLNAPEDCNSQLFNWAYGHVRAMGFANYRAITDEAYNITLMPYVYKLYIDGNNADEYFGKDQYGGKVYTESLLKSHLKSAKFWSRSTQDGLDTNWEEYGPNQDMSIDIKLQTGDVLLLGMHGSDLSIEDNLVETIRFMFTYGFDGDGDNGDLSDKEVKAMARDIRALIEGLPGGFDNPMLTLNAVASEGGFLTSTAKHEQEQAQENEKQEKGDKKNKKEQKGSTSNEDMGVWVADSLLIGDGILQFLDDIGLSETGPIFVYSHELGHLLQFEVDLKYIGGDTPDSHETRRVELMADAFASYYISHPDGENAAKGEVVRMTDAAFSLGDCSTRSDWHHGTPDQRRCAATWGSIMATSRGRKILHPQALSRKFDHILPSIVAVDPMVCSFGNDMEDVDAASKPAAEKEVAAFRSSQPTDQPTSTSSSTKKWNGLPIEPQILSPSTSPHMKASSSFGNAPSVAPFLFLQFIPTQLPTLPPSLRPTTDPSQAFEEKPSGFSTQMLTMTPTSFPSKSSSVVAAIVPPAMSPGAIQKGTTGSWTASTIVGVLTSAILSAVL